MQDLTISLVQSPLVWENPKQNLSYFKHLIGSYDDPSDVFILPEMFTTGFTMNASVTENFSTESETVAWMKELSREKKAAICGSVIMMDGETRRNRFLWVYEDEVTYYDKRHLWSYGNEHKHFTAGDSRVIINFKGWKTS